MDSIETEGSSIDEAIDSALRQLGATREKVDIEILSNAARGLFGLGARKARVRATIRRPIDAEPTGHAALSQRDPEPPRRAVAALQTAESVRRAPETEDVGAHARQVLQRIIALIGVPAEVAVTQDSGLILLDLRGDPSGVLIGRRGQTLDALEYIINRIVAREESPAARIVVDAQNYRARRREALEAMAQRMGEQAKKRRKAVTLNPMSPRDRRTVHVLLQNDPALATRSSGKGYFRRLVIIPAGAPRPSPDADDQD